MILSMLQGLMRGIKYLSNLRLCAKNAGGGGAFGVLAGHYGTFNIRREQQNLCSSLDKLYDSHKEMELSISPNLSP